MSFTSLGSFGTATGTTSGPTLVITTTTINLAVGNVCFIITGLNNTGTTDADHNEVSSITDSGSNTWVKVVEFTNGQGGAASGATCSLWQSKLTTGINIGGTITITYANSITARGAVTWAFSATGGALTVADTDTLANDASDLGSITSNPGVSREYIFIRGSAIEGFDDSTYTPTTNYTAIPYVNAAVGGFESNMATLGEFRILTATSSASDPSLGGYNLDSASVLAAIYEAPSSGSFLYGNTKYQPFLVR